MALLNLIALSTERSCNIDATNRGNLLPFSPQILMRAGEEIRPLSIAREIQNVFINEPDLREITEDKWN